MTPRQEGRPGSPVERQRGPNEPQEEHLFWCRYWQAVRSKGFQRDGRYVMSEHAPGFIRKIKPRRLNEGRPRGRHGAYLGLLALQPDSARLEDPAG